MSGEVFFATIITVGLVGSFIAGLARSNPLVTLTLLMAMGLCGELLAPFI